MLVVDDDEVVRKVVRMVLDVMMPGMDGIEVLRQLPAGVKVLMLTARDDAATEAASREAGAADFLAKPFSSVELLDHVERLVTADRAKAGT